VNVLCCVQGWVDPAGEVVVGGGGGGGVGGSGGCRGGSANLVVGIVCRGVGGGGLCAVWFPMKGYWGPPRVRDEAGVRYAAAGRGSGFRVS